MKIAQKQHGQGNSSEWKNILVRFFCMYILPDCYYYQLKARKGFLTETYCILDPEKKLGF